MKTTPKTEKELAELNLLPAGWYPFTIGKAEEKVSKKGNEMIELNVQVYKDAGFVFVRDFLMDTEFSATKLRHIADTCGLLADYESGGIDAEQLVKKEGYCKVTIKKDKNGMYPDQNNIADYAKEIPATAKPAGQPETAPAEDDTDLPF